MIFSLVHFQVFRGHFGGLWPSPSPYGKPLEEQLRRIPAGPIQPTLLYEGSYLWLRWDVSAFATELSGKRVCHG